MHQTKQYVHLAINYLQQLMALKVRFRAGGGHFAIKLCSMHLYRWYAVCSVVLFKSPSMALPISNKSIKLNNLDKEEKICFDAINNAA